MLFRSRRTWVQFLIALSGLGLGLGLGSQAQSNALLYDPEPPADSAYVRVMQVSPGGGVDVLVDGKPRVRSLASGAASDYMVLAAGPHTIVLRAAGKPLDYLSTQIEAVRGRAMTIAFTSLQAGSLPTVFDDKTNANKLRATLTAYDFDDRVGAVDVRTADGKTTVFSALTYGTSKSLQVNPVSVELVFQKTGDASPLGRSKIELTQGGAYSLMLLPGKNGKLRSNFVQNKIERYTGR